LGRPLLNTVFTVPEERLSRKKVGTIGKTRRERFHIWGCFRPGFVSVEDGSTFCLKIDLRGILGLDFVKSGQYGTILIFVSVSVLTSV
jgi:hypothetical protein